MLCTICKEKPATVHLTQIVGEKMQKLDLCEDCAKAKGVNDPAGFARVPEHGLSILCSGRQGLLAQHVQPLVEGSVGDFRVVGRRRGNIDEIQRPSLGGEQRAMVRVDASERKHFVRGLPASLADVGNGADFDRPAVAHVLDIGRRVALASDESVARYRTA